MHQTVTTPAAAERTSETTAAGLAWTTLLDPRADGRAADRAAIRELVAAHALRTAGEDAALRAAAGGFEATEVAITWRRQPPRGAAITLRSRILAAALGRTVLRCTVDSAGRRCAEAIVVADRRSRGAALSRVPPPPQRLGGWRTATQPG